MRRRPLVLSLALACAAALAAPLPAAAGTERCTLVLPTKVVVDAPIVQSSLRLGEDCAAGDADSAGWQLRHGRGALLDLDFTAYDLDRGVTAGTLEWWDDDPMGRYTARPTGARTSGDAALAQNSPATLVKYASRLLTRTSRSSRGSLTWSVTAQQWSGRAHRYVGRPKVRVGLFHRAPGSATWRYVRAGTTTSTGRVTIGLAAPKAGHYRLVVAETPTIWASSSTPVAGRR